MHKVHLRPTSNLYAYQKLVASLEAVDQQPSVALAEDDAAGAPEAAPSVSADDLRDRWSKLTDVHQFFGMLRTLKLDRQQAMRMVGQDYAWQLDTDAVAAMFNHVARDGLPIMCFVGSRGCVQIHSGPVRSIKPMGPWLNVLDETFHLHLRVDHIREVWAVRKPTREGHVTSLEAYGADGNLIIQFFGQRHEGEVERADWRFLAENMPRLPASTAA